MRCHAPCRACHVMDEHDACTVQWRTRWCLACRHRPRQSAVTTRAHESVWVGGNRNTKQLGRFLMLTTTDIRSRGRARVSSTSRETRECQRDSPSPISVFLGYIYSVRTGIRERREGEPHGHAAPRALSSKRSGRCQRGAGLAASLSRHVHPYVRPCAPSLHIQQHAGSTKMFALGCSKQAIKGRVARHRPFECEGQPIAALCSHGRA